MSPITSRVAAFAFTPLLAMIVACRSDPDARPARPQASSSAASASAPLSTMILATTTSTQDSGLLDVLIPPFERERSIQVKVIAVGTGAALAMAAKGDADAVLVHAPESEKKFVDSGDLVDGKLIMHNDFVLVGPPDDPAGVKKAGGLKA